MIEKKKKVVIIGAGIGGLSTAAVLSFSGFDVTILEKNNHIGGKASLLVKDGFSFDMGPSLLTLPEWIDEIFGQSMLSKRKAVITGSLDDMKTA